MAPAVLALLILTASLLPIATPYTVFNFSSFPPNTAGINYSGDAYASGDGVIQLTRNQVDGNLRLSSGHAIYSTPILLCDPESGATADFTTRFTFNIKVLNNSSYGDGLAFFIAPLGYSIPSNSYGGWLGLYNSTNISSTSSKVVAVEFDTYMNTWDSNDNHIGINLNSIVSNATMTWVTDMKDQNVGSAMVSYSSTTSTLSVHLSYTMFWANTKPELSYTVNLSEFVSETVIVGFSAATGHSTELHQIISWDFESSFVADEQTTPRSHKRHGPWVLGLVVALGVLVAAFGYFLIIWKRPRKKQGKVVEDDDVVLDRSMEAKLVNGTGSPKKFTYKELVMATKNFSEEGKLGQGGFGGVYMGVLNGEKVAVKRVSPGSSQGRKEYVSEVTVISRLRHRNLVRLMGWCHEYGELLLVYEYMPNGSLDSYLFGKRESLSWGTRYRIVHGLALGLVYLHEEWEQCVVHRDVKASNVMLDSGFNAKLGDFGLARMVDHGLGSQTTVLAGTMGYLAPECVSSGRASKESDVYSFGVVALEIACGRRAVESKASEAEVKLVDWVWGLYGEGRVGEAMDRRLGGVFDEREAEMLVVVGLWCAHPNHEARPTMREVIHVMTLQAPVPKIPRAMPRPVYSSALDMNDFLDTSTESYGTESATTATTGSAGSRNQEGNTASSRASSADCLL